jgi:hypothetical protein
VIYRLDTQLSKASSVRTTRTFRLDLPLCRVASNCSSLHLSGPFNSTSGRHSVFDQLWDFFPKHKYGKIAATVQTMWIFVRTHSSIRQISHSNFRRPDAILHGPNARRLDMEIACSKDATVRKTGQHRPDAAQIRKEFLRILESRSQSCPDGAYVLSSQTLIWTLSL